MNISGIYKIQSLTFSERCYIGSAVNIHARWAAHISCLKSKKHHSNKLQNHVNKYGINDLSFNILCECKKEELISTEQIYLNSEKPFFNTCIIAGSSLGLKWKNTPEAIKRMADGHRGIKQSELTQERKRAKLKGRRPADITIQRAIEVNRTRIQSKEEREKKSKSLLGNKRALGKHWKLTEATKQKMSRSKIERNKRIA